MQFGGQPTPWSEVEVEGLRLRSVSQILIQEIGAAGPENAEDSARRACGVIRRQADQIVSGDARIAELESALKRQAAAVKMIDMSHVARAETMMQHAQVLHDQSNTEALESERQANALLTERIAELEQAVTVRDTEIARLETDLELVRRDVDHLRLFARIRFGYAPGDYFGICHCCKAQFIGDKRATNCEACADKAIDAARAGNGGGV